MILNRSELVEAILPPRKKANQWIECLQLKGGLVLALSQKNLALYQSLESIDDPLGHGFLGLEDLPTAHIFDGEPPWVDRYQAGFIGFKDGKALLITPKGLRLYPDKLSALQNQALICELALP
ncbi:MAG: hypothetical protein OXE99_12180 [Cellvibrionales bacterium]|nr:hypothetical protein [Cellvibrionales bacterium]